MVASAFSASPSEISGTPSTERAKHLTSPRSGTSVTTCWMAKFWPLMALVSDSNCRTAFVTSLAQSSDRYFTPMSVLSFFVCVSEDSVNWMVDHDGKEGERQCPKQ